MGHLQFFLKTADAVEEQVEAIAEVKVEEKQQTEIESERASNAISVLAEQEQTILASVMDKLGVIPTRSQLVKIKEQRKTEVLAITVIEAILSEGGPATVQVVLK